MKIGQPCIVTARDAFYAHIDGWPVEVVACNGLTASASVAPASQGFAWVSHTNDERQALFLVPLDQLRAVAALPTV